MHDMNAILHIYGGPEHFSGSFEDDGHHAGYALEPCPFCGGHRLELCNTHTPSYWIRCLTCGAEAHGNLPSGGGEHIQSERLAVRLHMRAIRSAVRKWNRRAIHQGRTLSPGNINGLLAAMDRAGFTQAERNNARLRKAASALLTNGDEEVA